MLKIIGHNPWTQSELSYIWPAFSMKCCLSDSNFQWRQISPR